MKENPPQQDAPAPVSNRRRGAALLIVLAFIVLVTGIVVAFFSRAMSERQVSNTSASQTKVELFAQGAMNMIIGDLKQEIVTSSSAVPVASGTLYTPKTNANMIPALAGSTGTSGLENLLKVSGLAAPYTGGTTRASTASTTGTSLNGRSFSAHRWNKALLMPATSGTDFTPLLTSGTFTPPNWVLVARNGSTPASTTFSAPLAWSTNNSTTIVGRYAYAIYDEGGLLDANVAGGPIGSGSSAVIPQAAYKPGLSYADLTQINLTVGQIDQLVAWRNYASTQAPGSSFTSPGFTATSGSNYFRFVTSNTTGFLTTGTALNGTQTDRMFISRQELLNFLQTGLGLSATSQAIQCLSTFSRALEQPSFVSDPNRPKVLGAGLPPAAVSVTSYVGNNTYWGGEGAINLTGSGGFLAARVTNSFTRLDGSTAVVGEPLVKRRFALSRLQLVTTAATANATPGDPIYDRFGLHRSNTSSPWIYDHGIKGGSFPIIGTLTSVAAANREPDFAELLKATINVGSVGKAGPSNLGNNYQYLMDVSGDLQILQIMANLIDQQKTDNFPTWIQYVDGNGQTRNIYGTQDLPYFYRWHYFSVATKVPSPSLTSLNTVNIMVTGTSGTSTIKLNHAQAGTLIQPGSAAYMIIPQVWNPHDANTPAASSGGPTEFRVVVETNAPYDTSGTGAWQISVRPSSANGNFDGGSMTTGTVTAAYTGANPPGAATSSTVALNAANGSYVGFKFNNATTLASAFREPTLLWRDGIPSGMTLSGTSRKEDTSLTGNTYYGILVGDASISWPATITGTFNGVVSSTNYICQTSTLCRGTAVPGTDNYATDNFTFRMQYKDASGNWITYQDAYSQATLQNVPGHTLFVNAAEPTYSGTNQYKNPLMTGINASGPQLTAPQGGPYDPRSNRFSTPITGAFKGDDPTLNGNPTLDAVTLVSNANTNGTQNNAVGSSNFVLMKTQRPATSRGQSTDYLVPCSDMTGRGSYNAQMRWYSSTNWMVQLKGPTDTSFFDGLLSQNNPAALLLGGSSTAQSIYYEDPDGICRRAMGGYVPVSGNPTGSLTNTATATGLPMVTSGATFANGVVTPTTQSQSRPIILHRPFRSVAEMSYAFRGTPWKNIDFFTPESGDAALLDVFCVNEPPTDAVVAGKVNLNTKQTPVLKAILAGAYRDEFANLPTPPTSGTLPSLATAEAANLASMLRTITSGTLPYRGPLTNVADLVGHYCPPQTRNPVNNPDVYSYQSPATLGRYSNYAGFSAALSGTAQDGSDIWTTQSMSSRNIQRFREAPIRALTSCGQTRVWNLLIDVVAQSGRYLQNASSLDKFIVEGEKRYWVHVAIDRYTGQVIDTQVEAVTE